MSNADAVLERKPVVEDFDEAEFNLANESSNLLSYPLLLKKVTSKKASHFKQALNELKVEPFTTQSVGRYKRKMERYYMFTNANFYTILAVELMAWVAMLTVVGSMLGMLVSVIFWFTINAVQGWIFLSGVIMFILAMVGVVINEKIKVKTTKWQKIKICKYKRQIPEFVLQTAVDLKKKCSDTIFYIDEMSISHRVLDPFLVAVVEDEECYLEVWNEPMFRK